MKVLLLNQCFYPDVVSTAQHLTDLAVGLSERGHEVTVVCGSRGYDNPEVRFPARETWKGIEIIRIPTLGLGKRAKWRRAADFASFLFFCACRLAVLPRQDATVALTSPPLISFFGALFVRLKGGRFYFWVMDLNPDEAIAAGWLKESSLASKFFQLLLHYSLRHARKVFVLDRFMKRRVLAKGIAENRVEVIAPWSHDDAIRYDAEGRRAFRDENGLSHKFVVMYSGNHSPCHPLDTLLAAADALRAREDIAFCFVGGGSEQQKVKRFAEARGISNIVCLPYQPMGDLSASLSAADMHAVVMGDPFLGIVHPCKIYNILALGTPILYVGPAESHVTDIVSGMSDGYARCARHGSGDEVVEHILACAASPRSQSSDALRAASDFSLGRLLPRMLEIIESSGSKFSRESSAAAESGNSLDLARPL
ncbi:MAG: glycosyltransferase family 4 protein, partial [Pyrinomonadaceae bacterium]